MVEGSEPPGSRPPAPKRQISLWALASLLCGVSFVCPIAAGLGIVLGLMALVDLNRHPHRTGKRLAVAGLLLSFLAVAGWGVAARWWNEHARRPMLHGPAAEIEAGLAGDVRGFLSGFQVAGTPADELEAAAFLNAVSRRYGRFLGSTQNREIRQDGPDALPNPRRMRILYVFTFESGPVDAEAEFIVMGDGGPALVLQFSWLVVRDDELGDLLFPASAVIEPNPAELPRGQ